MDLPSLPDIDLSLSETTNISSSTTTNPTIIETITPDTKVGESISKLRNNVEIGINKGYKLSTYIPYKPINKFDEIISNNIRNIRYNHPKKFITFCGICTCLLSLPAYGTFGILFRTTTSLLLSTTFIEPNLFIKYSGSITINEYLNKKN